MRNFNWKISKNFYFQNISLLPHLRAQCFRFKETKKTYYFNSDESLLARKIASQSRLDDKIMGFEVNCIFVEEDASKIHVSWKKLVKPAKTEVLKKKKKRVGWGRQILFAITQNKKIFINKKKNSLSKFFFWNY